MNFNCKASLSGLAKLYRPLGGAGEDERSERSQRTWQPVCGSANEISGANRSSEPEKRAPSVLYALRSGDQKHFKYGASTFHPLLPDFPRFKVRKARLEMGSARPAPA